jgi:hypothetical protein
VEEDNRGWALELHSLLVPPMTKTRGSWLQVLVMDHGPQAAGQLIHIDTTQFLALVEHGSLALQVPMVVFLQAICEVALLQAICKADLVAISVQITCH